MGVGENNIWIFGVKVLFFNTIRISAHAGNLENQLFEKHDQIEKYYQENKKVGAYIRCGGDEKCVQNITRKRKI
jgi:hypothetical protein